MAKKLYIEDTTSKGWKYVEDGTEGAGFSSVNDSIPCWHTTSKAGNDYTISSYTNKDYLFHVAEIRRIVTEAGNVSTISDLAAPPTSPSTGDRHRVIATATGDWVGKEGFIAEYDTTSWLFKTDEEAGFDDLSTPNKLICCEHEVGSHDQWVAIVGGSNVVALAMQFGGKSYWCRAYRANNAMSVLKSNFSFDEIQSMETEAIDHNIYDSYLVHGRYGSVIGEGDGVYDWIYGTAGTKFDGVGLINKGWTPSQEASLQDVCDKVIDQLVYGNQLM